MKNLGLIVLFALGGCSPTGVATCNPACESGFHCDNGACVSDGAGDMAAGGGDMAGCHPACNGLSPYCNGTNHCVGCLKDDQCAAGQYCKITGDALAVCTPGCMDDGRCGGGSMKCCGNRCVDTQADAANC